LKVALGGLLIAFAVILKKVAQFISCTPFHEIILLEVQTDKLQWGNSRCRFYKDKPINLAWL
jgi:hypothetical protein